MGQSEWRAQGLAQFLPVILGNSEKHLHNSGVKLGSGAAMELFARRPMYMGALKRALGKNLLTTPNDEWRPARKRTAGYFDGS